MPDILDQLLEQRAANRAQRDPLRELALALDFKRYRRQLEQDALDQARIDEERPYREALSKKAQSDVAEDERTKRLRTLRESYYKNVGMIDPASMDANTEAEVQKGIYNLQGQGALTASEADEQRGKFDRFRAGIELTKKGLMKETQLTPEQQKVYRDEQQELLGMHVAPATAYDQQVAEGQQQQLNVDRWSLKEAQQIQGYIDQIMAKGGKLSDLSSTVPEAYQMKVAQALGFDKELAAQREAQNAPGSPEDFKTMEALAKQESDLMDLLDPNKGGKDDYVTVPASTVNRMREKKAQEFGERPWWQGGDTSDDAEQRAKEYITKTARPVGETEQQALGRDEVTGELFAFYVPKDAFVEERQEAIRQQLADVRAARKALVQKVVGRTVPQDSAQAQTQSQTSMGIQPEPGTPEQVSLPEGEFGGPWEAPPSDMTFDTLVEVTQQALMGGLVDPEALEKELTDPQIRLELMKAYNATPEQLDQILRMIVGLGAGEE